MPALSLPATFLHTNPLHLVLLFLAAFVAGAINSVAGGGTILTFPTLLTILGPAQSVLANGTSTVALVPGSVSAYWNYRSEVKLSRTSLWQMAVPSLLGGGIGAYLATHVNAKLFSHLVPWLILGATFLFLIQDPVRRWVDKRRAAGGGEAAGERPLGVGGMIFQFFVALYGGFFGAGIGILMLAALGFLGQTNIHRMNGLKNFAAVCINGIGTALFIYYGKVNWSLAILMAVAAIAGGWGGAGVARKMGQANVRRVVIGVGLVFGLFTLAQQIGLV